VCSSDRNYALLAGKKQSNRNAMGPPKKVGACALQQCFGFARMGKSVGTLLGAVP